MEIWLLIAGAIFAIIGYLLARKDAQQEAQIKTLWEKHDEDAKRLQDLELDIAKRHYVKDELDQRFDRLENSIRSGMDSISGEVRNLRDAIMKGIAP